MTIKINISAEIDLSDAPSREAAVAVAIAFFRMRGSLAWSESAATRYSVGTADEKGIFREAVNQLVKDAQPEINVEVETVPAEPEPELSAEKLKPLKDKIAARDGITHSGARDGASATEDRPLIRPMVTMGEVSELIAEGGP